jgi:hypothetical protein
MLRRRNELIVFPRPLPVPQCRQFSHLDGEHHSTCHKHLSNTSTYFLRHPLSEFAVDSSKSPWDQQNVFGPFEEVLETYTKPECVASIMSTMCNNVFRQCQEVEGGVTGEKTKSKTWVPALPCHSDCQERWSVWEECLADLEANAETMEAFDAAMSNALGQLHFLLLFRYQQYQGGHALQRT